MRKSSRASSFLPSLPPLSPCHTKSLQPQSSLPLPVLEILLTVAVCAVPARVSGPLPLPFSLWAALFALPAMAPYSSDDLYKSGVQTSCFQEGSTLAPPPTRVRCAQPPVPLLARCLQRHLLHFTSLPIMRYFGKQHVPGSSCTLPLRELLHNQGDCLNRRTVLSSDVNFPFSLA